MSELFRICPKEACEECGRIYDMNQMYRVTRKGYPELILCSDCLSYEIVILDKDKNDNLKIKKNY